MGKEEAELLAKKIDAALFFARASFYIAIIGAVSGCLMVTLFGAPVLQGQTKYPFFEERLNTQHRIVRNMIAESSRELNLRLDLLLEALTGPTYKLPFVIPTRFNNQNHSCQSSGPRIVAGETQ